MTTLIDEIKKQLTQARKDFEDFGGWPGLRAGEFVWNLVHKSFAGYWEKADVASLQEKYGTRSASRIASKLVSAAATKAALLGGVTGATISADELTALFTGGEGLVGLPANVAIAVAAIGAETILMVRIQLQLVAHLAKLHEVALDPEDPEDIMTILAFAIGGTAAENAGKFGMKVGGKLAGRAAKSIFKKKLMAAFKEVANKVGIRIVQKSVVKYTVPIASIAIGSSWNYLTTRRIATIATSHFSRRLEQAGRDEIPTVGNAKPPTTKSKTGARKSATRAAGAVNRRVPAKTPAKSTGAKPAPKKAARKRVASKRTPPATKA